MKYAIRYYTKTGNTEILANIISKELNIPSLTIDEPINEEVDILFLCNSIYGGTVAPEVKLFIDVLDPSKVKKVVNVSTACLLSSTYKAVKKLLDKKGIPLDEQEFHCKGKFKNFRKTHPDLNDINNLKNFVAKFK